MPSPQYIGLALRHEIVMRRPFGATPMDFTVDMTLTQQQEFYNKIQDTVVSTKPTLKSDSLSYLLLAI